MIKLTEILKKIFINEYNKSQLDYIALKLNIPRTSDFESILGALDAKGIKYPELKDKILKGEIKTLEDLETLRGTPKRIKAGKINTGEADANLVYNQDGLRVYWAKDKNACVKYGNGYSFCISSRGHDNNYLLHRKESGTPYFVFDDTKTSDKDKNGNFIDPTHLLVVFAVDEDFVDHADLSFNVAESDNNKEEDWFEDFNKMINKYPRLSNLKNILINKEISKKDQKAIAIYNEFNDLVFRTENFEIPKDFGDNTWRDIISSLNKIIEFQKGNLPLYRGYEEKDGKEDPNGVIERGFYEDLDKMLKNSWWYNRRKYKITKEGNKTKVYIEPSNVGNKYLRARVMVYEKIPYDTQEIANLNPILEKFINFYKKYNIKSKSEISNI
jgi:hypothetical protein